MSSLSEHRFIDWTDNSVAVKGSGNDWDRLVVMVWPWSGTVWCVAWKRLIAINWRISAELFGAALWKPLQKMSFCTIKALNRLPQYGKRRSIASGNRTTVTNLDVTNKYVYWSLAAKSWIKHDNTSQQKHMRSHLSVQRCKECRNLFISRVAAYCQYSM